MQISQADITQQNQQQYLISGVVDFSTVPALQQQSAKYFSAIKAAHKEIVHIDWAEVNECNSAALALLFEIVSSAKQKQLTVQFKNLPVTLLSIAKAYGVEDEIREFCR